MEAYRNSMLRCAKQMMYRVLLSHFSNTRNALTQCVTKIVLVSHSSAIKEIYQRCHPFGTATHGHGDINEKLTLKAITKDPRWRRHNN